jgi:hypothetical protein
MLNYGENIMTRIPEPLRYFKLVQRILTRFHILEPKEYCNLFRIHETENEVLGWQISDRKIKYRNSSFIKVNIEQGVYQKECGNYAITELGYHYEPNSNGYFQFRFDMHSEDLHANPDSRLNMQHKIVPGEIQFDFSEMNLYLMLKIVEHYITTKNYPLDNSFEKEYNRIASQVRSEMKSGKNKRKKRNRLF